MVEEINEVVKKTFELNTQNSLPHHIKMNKILTYDKNNLKNNVNDTVESQEYIVCYKFLICLKKEYYKFAPSPNNLP